MTVVSSTMLLAGASIAILAGIGVLRFRTSFARFHAAGKASPIAFLVAVPAAAIETGWGGTVRLIVASAALVLTLPVGVHLLFRAVHRTTSTDLVIDELEPEERAGRRRG